MSCKCIQYDAETENGIPYLSGLYINNFEYKTVVNDLDGMVEVRKSIVSGGGGVTSYTIGSRSLSRQALSASELLKLWDDLMAKKKQLEQGRSARKSVGVVFRDW